MGLNKNKFALLAAAVFVIQAFVLLAQLLTWQALRDLRREVYYVGYTVAGAPGGELAPLPPMRASLTNEH